MDDQIVKAERRVWKDVPMDIKAPRNGDGALCFVDTGFCLVNIGESCACSYDDRRARELLLERVDIAETLSGPLDARKEQDFRLVDRVHRVLDMVEQAFDDQCTGANPRYPLMSEIKQMYLNAYYGGAK